MSNPKSSVDLRADLAELVKRKAEIAVSILKIKHEILKA
jgi:hypothetical protein